MSQASRSERDVCTKLITPALERAGWDIQGQVREEVSLTRGQVMVRGRLVARGTAKRVVPDFKPSLLLAGVELKLCFVNLYFNRLPGRPSNQRQGAFP
jgi:type I restriction enzyme R subunit